MTTAQNKFEDFLIARGGPFYELQVRLGIIHEGVLRVRDRALFFVGLAWAVPLDRKSTRLNSSHIQKSRMPSSA